MEYAADAPSIELPAYAQLPINRCNLPAMVLGGLEFQRAPCRLTLDGVTELHHRLFAQHLPPLRRASERAQCFMDYTDVAFRLQRLEDVGWSPNGPRKRINANYLRMIRGWSVDANQQEGAVLKGWTASRFGLRPRYHDGCLHDVDGEPHARYLSQRTRGVFATNALDSQLDILYTYCQYELHRDGQKPKTLVLYRGVTRLDHLDVRHHFDQRRCVLLFNNLSSFSSERERAEEFGDLILQARVPTSKIVFHSNLLPRMLTGENEYMVLGGLYEVQLSIY